MIPRIRAWTARHGRALLLLGILAVATFQLGQVLRSERALTGGELSLPLDDSFIYLQYARAMAEGRPLVYTGGNQPTTGATSLAYPLLLVPPHLLRLDPAVCVAWALGLGVLGFVASAFLAARLGRQLGGAGGGALALVLFLVSPHLLWGYLSGMEIALYGTVLLATVGTYLRERDAGRFSTLRWWLFALAVSRPEGALLAFVFGALMAIDRRRASRRPGGPVFASPALLLPFAAAALPFLVNLAVTGSIEPTSAAAKSILAEPYRESLDRYLASTPRIWLDIARSYLSQFLLDAQGLPIPRMELASGAGLALFGLFAFRPRGPWNGGQGLLLILTAGLLVNSLPVFWQVHYFRYQQGLHPLWLTLFAAGWGRLAWWAWSRRPRVLGVPVGAAALALPLAAWMPLLWQANGEMIRLYGHNCENILHQQIRVGRWIDRNLPADAIVGLNDAGAIAYYGRRSTLDLIGITTAGFAKVYRSGLGCLFEHLRRLPPERLPDYFAIYPEWFPYWPESGLLGPEAFRAHLAFNTICGGTDKVVYPASWIDVRPTDEPISQSSDLAGKRRVDALDHAWLEDERRHEWTADPEAKDVLRLYAYADVPTRPVADAGRIVRGAERFRTHAIPGKDLTLVMRTDAWYPNRLQVAVDGVPAGAWTIAFSETAWVEPRIVIPGRLLTRERPEITITRDPSSEARDYTPFHYWMYQ